VPTPCTPIEIAAGDVGERAAISRRIEKPTKALNVHLLALEATTPTRLSFFLGFLSLHAACASVRLLHT
jgi:hypothetical protein